MSRYVFCFRLNGIENQSCSALALRSSRMSPRQAISNPYHFAFACYVRCSLFVVRSLFAVVAVDVAAIGFLWLHFEISNAISTILSYSESIVQPSALSNASITCLSRNRSCPLSHCTISEIDLCAPVLVPITLHFKLTFKGNAVLIRFYSDRSYRIFFIGLELQIVFIAYTLLICPSVRFTQFHLIIMHAIYR